MQHIDWVRQDAVAAAQAILAEKDLHAPYLPAYADHDELWFGPITGPADRIELVTSVLYSLYEAAAEEVPCLWDAEARIAQVDEDVEYNGFTERAGDYLVVRIFPASSPWGYEPDYAQAV